MCTQMMVGCCGIRWMALEAFPGFFLLKWILVVINNAPFDTVLVLLEALRSAPTMTICSFEHGGDRSVDESKE